jgi:branched-chain amino acid transport system permease protein
MVYGIIKLLNFAHGDIYMSGAFVCLTVFGVFSRAITGWPSIALSFVVSMAIAAALGYLAQRFAYRPLLGAPRLSLLITAIGVSLIIYNSAMAITNSKPLYLNIEWLDSSAGVKFGNVSITYMKMAMLFASAALMAGLTFFIGRTMLGKAMRAISLDKDTCRLMGVNVNKIIGFTFILGSALAAIAGGMACIYYGKVQYDMGFSIGIKAFTSAVIGGIGSIPGAMLGGLLLGLLEAIGTQFFKSEWKDVFAFGLLILMLIFRPNGLMGKSEIERM